jgi:hypothetical protein
VSVHGLSRHYFDYRKLVNSDFNADPDPAFLSKSETDPVSKNIADFAESDPDAHPLPG